MLLLSWLVLVGEIEDRDFPSDFKSSQLNECIFSAEIDNFCHPNGQNQHNAVKGR